MRHINFTCLVMSLIMLIGVMVDQAASEAPRWAIALHGGAGSLDRTMPASRQASYQKALTKALQTGVRVLDSGGTALDATQQVVMSLEDCPLFNAGRGAVFNQAGGHGMDASIMDGSTMSCGGVALVSRLRNPIHAARIVMEQTPHVLLAREPAERFCIEHGAKSAPLSYFNVKRRFEMLRSKMREMGLTPPEQPIGGWPKGSPRNLDVADEVGGTVGCVALDSQGRLAAATSTGGRNAKMLGRVGDSPIPGAGNYANSVAAVGGTGVGEEFLRYFIAGRVALLVEQGRMTLDEACAHCLEDVLKPGDGGLIAVGRDGAIVTQTTTGSLPRGTADSTGRFEVDIWFE